MKKATSVILPADVLRFILNAFNKKGKRSRRAGSYGYIHDLTKSITNFMDNKRGCFPELDALFAHGVTECMVKRAFNLKTPYGATKDMRNILALYASNGKLNWNQFIEKRFPHHISLLDKNMENTVPRRQKHTIDELYDLVYQYLTKR
ncbi:MAG: hypothetical protein ABR968_07050 [Bacteroidales bacterium]|jgi:hypothetical protein